MPPEFTFRLATASDFNFYKTLHHDLFEELVTPIWGWNPPLQLEIVKRQFEPDKVRVIQVDETDIGVVQIEERPGEIFLSQLWIDRAWQNQGIGTSIVKGTMERAAEKGLLMRLHVLRTNRARALYERLGFIEDGTDEGGSFLKWAPPHG